LFASVLYQVKGQPPSFTPGDLRRQVVHEMASHHELYFVSRNIPPKKLKFFPLIFLSTKIHTIS